MNFTLKLNRLYHYIFGEKFYKKLEFEWHKYPDRCQIIQETILMRKHKVVSKKWNADFEFIRFSSRTQRINILTLYIDNFFEFSFFLKPA